ncbi:hypothetical protein LEP1GSC073_0315 [Leptospira noguchii str. Cascata]|nr:hypothetical protein LEP1GSC073_0315 [Leptospira noguchii str. Cascata]
MVVILYLVGVLKELSRKKFEIFQAKTLLNKGPNSNLGICLLVEYSLSPSP